MAYSKALIEVTGACYFCGAERGLVIHHINRNRADNQLKNLVVLCGSCHRKIHQVDVLYVEREIPKQIKLSDVEIAFSKYLGDYSWLDRFKDDVMNFLKELNLDIVI